MGSSRSTCLVIAITQSLFVSGRSTPRLESYTPPTCVWEGQPPEISPVRGRTCVNWGRSSRKGSARDGIAGVGRLRVVVPVRVHAVGLDDGRERRDPLVAAEPHDDDALC